MQTSGRPQISSQTATRSPPYGYHLRPLLIFATKHEGMRRYSAWRNPTTYSSPSAGISHVSTPGINIVYLRGLPRGMRAGRRRISCSSRMYEMTRRGLKTRILAKYGHNQQHTTFRYRRRAALQKPRPRGKMRLGLLDVL